MSLKNIARQRQIEIRAFKSFSRSYPDITTTVLDSLVIAYRCQTICEGEGFGRSYYAEAFGLCISNSDKRLYKLIDLGYLAPLREQVAAQFSYYTLTPEGLKILARYNSIYTRLSKNLP